MAVFSATFPPYYAGSGNACFYQAQAIAELGHDVTVFTATYDGEPVDPGSVEVRRHRPVLRLGNAPLIPRLAAIRGYDVLHLHQPFIFGTDAALIARGRQRIPIVSSFHNSLLAEGIKGALFRFYNRTVTRAAVRRSAVLTVLSLEHAASVPELADELARRPAAFITTPNGVDDAFHPGASPVREQLGLADDDLVALVCAKLDAAHLTKRVDLAVRAVAAVDDRRVKLLVLGGGNLQTDYEQLATSLGIADRVRFVGDQPHARVPDFYRAADFLVSPSDSESFGITQIEAMACGKPVIITRLPGARDVSSDGVHGFHVEPGDLGELTASVRRMVAVSPAARGAMGAAGRERVLSRYTWAHSAQRLEQAYRRAAHGVRREAG
ncbi:MAG: glycosyltransferase family 4 protein [Solirubrobacteraceae bacterium]